MTPDVNVLIAASRAEHLHHPVAHAWLTRALAQAISGEALLLFPMVVASFVRLVRNPKVFAIPSTPDEAVTFVDDLLVRQGVRMPLIGEEWPEFRVACLDANLHSNDIPDAWLAAAVHGQGDHLATFDTGFRRLLKRSELTILS